MVGVELLLRKPEAGSSVDRGEIRLIESVE